MIAGTNFDHVTNSHPRDFAHQTDADFGWLHHIPIRHHSIDQFASAARITDRRLSLWLTLSGKSATKMWLSY